MKAAGKKGVASKSAGPKLRGFLGATKKKPEPDTPIVRSPKAGRAARMERLKNQRI